MQNSPFKKYIFETSAPYCCVACLLQIIINTEFSISYGQIHIADSFGVHVPEDYKGSINNTHITNDPNLFGIILTSNAINIFFSGNNIALKERYYSISLFEDWMFENKIQQELNNSSHIIVGYDYGALNDKPEFNTIGHVSLIVNFDTASHIVTIFDPGPDKPGIKKVKTYDLFRAIKKKKDGLWCISRM
ncbi:MAG: hypothetical protein HF982_15105 [Desulfobacteraceae bacterium]|nr:hypothetical protein [Desulfobacteraceae bacterium]MBC2720884.1 hypothetical protein [Desulfobacteraceae bacterium]